MSQRRTARPAPAALAGMVSLPRALSKLGYCSRTVAEGLIAAGRVTVEGRAVRDTSFRVAPERSSIAVDGEPLRAHAPVYLMLNKPRGLVTTRHDPEGRGTVYDCLPADLPFLSPVGRLDKASEGLLLFTNDTGWANHLLDPASGIAKTYHVKIDRVADAALLAGLAAPVEEGGEMLNAASATLLRSAERSSWLEIVLTEGRNRQVRRMLAAQGAGVLRLVRVAFGGVVLGDLPKGAVRPLLPSLVVPARRPI